MLSWFDEFTTENRTQKEFQEGREAIMALRGNLPPMFGLWQLARLDRRFNISYGRFRFIPFHLVLRGQLCEHEGRFYFPVAVQMASFLSWEGEAERLRRENAAKPLNQIQDPPKPVDPQSSKPQEDAHPPQAMRPRLHRAPAPRHNRRDRLWLLRQAIGDREIVLSDDWFRTGLSTYPAAQAFFWRCVQNGSLKQTGRGRFIWVQTHEEMAAEAVHWFLEKFIYTGRGSRGHWLL